MFRLHIYANIGSRLLAVPIICLGAAVCGTSGLAALPSSGAAFCIGPTNLEARLHAKQDADSYAALGNWFGEHHQAECAVASFQAGLKLEPDSAYLSYLLGLSLYSAGHLQEAIDPLRRASHAHPEEIKTHLLLGTAFDGLGRHKEAFQEWTAAIKIDPHSKIALDGLAKGYIEAGDYEPVITHLSVIQRDENLTLDLALAFTKAHMLDDAAQVLIEGLKSYPNSDALARLMVTVYVKQQRFQEASALAEKTARQYPRDMEAQSIYLRVMLFNGAYEKAAPLARKLLALAPHDADLLHQNGIMENKMGDYEAAKKHLEEAITLNPNYYNSRYIYAMVLEQLNDQAGAKAQLEKAFALGATEPQIHLELAKVLHSLGEAQEAQKELDIYQAAWKSATDRTLAEQKATQAAEAAAAGNKQKAASLYREAATELPDSAGIAYRLALVLNDLGDMEGERSALEQAIKADPNYALAQYQLGYVESRGGDSSGAEQQFRLAIKGAPDYVQAWVALSATLAMESRFKEAQNAVATALKIDPKNKDALELSKNLAYGPGQH